MAIAQNLVPQMRSTVDKSWYIFVTTILKALTRAIDPYRAHCVTCPTLETKDDFNRLREAD